MDNDTEISSYNFLTSIADVVLIICMSNKFSILIFINEKKKKKNAEINY
jgi:hypothetical protein